MIIEWSYGTYAQLQRYLGLSYINTESVVDTVVLAVGILSLTMTVRVPDIIFTERSSDMIFVSRQPDVIFTEDT